MCRELNFNQKGEMAHHFSTINIDNSEVVHGVLSLIIKVSRMTRHFSNISVFRFHEP